MKIEEKEAIEILEKYNQHHIVKHIENLDDKEKILEQINEINFEEFTYLYNRTKLSREKKTSEIKPINTIVADDIEELKRKEYIEAGEKILSQNKFAAVTMAGGQGTRLRA